MLFDAEASLRKFENKAPAPSKTSKLLKKERKHPLLAVDFRSLESLEAPQAQIPEKQFIAEPSPDSALKRAATLARDGKIPREWSDGFATLCTMSRPEDFRPGRWQQIVVDGREFILDWSEQVAALGWSTLDVFGVTRCAPEARFDGRGLVPLLNGAGVLAVTADSATVSDSHGGRRNVNRVATIEDGARCFVWEIEI